MDKTPNYRESIPTFGSEDIEKSRKIYHSNEDISEQSESENEFNIKRMEVEESNNASIPK